MLEPGAILALAMFAAACAALLAGYPVAFTLGGVAILFALIALGLERFFDTPLPFDIGYVTLLPERIFGTISNETLLAVPLFVAMGVVLERSKVAEDLLQTMGQLFGRMRGGLGISVALVGGLLAASTGIVGATVVTMGLLSLPIMLRRGYDPKLATGIIAASGTLGQIIPPSIVLILLGDVLSSAYQQAQRAMGNMSPDPLSVGDLFAGALLPGLLLVGTYILYQIAMAIFRPESSPAILDDDLPRVSLTKVLSALMAPLALIIAVLGSILSGIATPTEAAGVGAIGALMLGAMRSGGKGGNLVVIGGLSLAALVILARTSDLRLDGTNPPLAWLGVGLAGMFAVSVVAALVMLARAQVLLTSLRATVLITTMVFTILIGAALFSLVFRGLGGDDAVHHWLSNMPGGAVGALLIVMLVMFLLGFFLDFIEIIFVVVPIVAPVLLTMGVDPVWLGIMMAMNLQTSFLTPPFGFALFYLRGVAPESIKTTDIYRGALPFVAIQLAMLGILAAFPALATWLPSILGAK